MIGTLEKRLAGTAFAIESFAPRTLADAFAAGKRGQFSLQQGRTGNAFQAEIERTSEGYVISARHSGLPPQIVLPMDEKTQTAFEQPARYVTTPHYRYGDYEVQLIRAAKGDELIVKKIEAKS